MCWYDWLGLGIFVFLMLRGAAPKPWTQPGYGKRRQTDNMNYYRNPPA